MTTSTTKSAAGKTPDQNHQHSKITSTRKSAMQDHQQAKAPAQQNHQHNKITCSRITRRKSPTPKSKVRPDNAQKMSFVFNQYGSQSVTLKQKNMLPLPLIRISNATVAFKKQQHTKPPAQEQIHQQQRPKSKSPAQEMHRMPRRPHKRARCPWRPPGPLPRPLKCHTGHTE